MSKKLKVIYEDNNKIYLSWDKVSGTKYIINGKDTSFNDVRITETKDSSIILDKDKIRNYLELYVLYVLDGTKLNKENVIDKSNIVNISTSILKMLTISTIESYKGYSIVINSNEIYDKFILYEVCEDRLNLVLEAQDFIITNDKLSKDKTYYIEGYKIKEDTEVLSAKSLMFTIKDYELVNPVDIKLSIVIPVYNCENYLPRCMDSVLLSKLKDIEIILVNDGSKDKSLDVIKWYQKKYSSIIKVIDKKNGGPASARNEGTKIAQGEYIAYIDSDDMVHPNMFYELYKGATLEDADFAVGKVIHRGEDYKNDLWMDVQEKEKGKRYISYTYEDMIYNKWYNYDECIYIVTLWNQIMKTSLAKAHPIPDFKYYEDAAYTRSIYSYGNKFVIALDAYYVWDRRISNTTGTISSFYNSKEPIEVLSDFYSRAIFYWLEDYRKDRFDYLMFDSFKEASNYLQNAINYEKNKIKENAYVKIAAYLLSKYDLNNNKMIVADQELVHVLSELGKYIK